MTLVVPSEYFAAAVVLPVAVQDAGAVHASLSWPSASYVKHWRSVTEFDVSAIEVTLPAGS